MSDNAWTKVAQAVIRVVAFGLVVIGFLLCSGELYYLYSISGLDPAQRELPRPHWGWTFLKGLPIVAGMILFLTTRGLAERLTRELD